MESLELQNYSWNDRDEKHYKTCFSNLTRLVLKNPKQIGIDPEFIEKIGKWCGNLRSLALTLYHRDLFSRVHRFCDPFLPKLETLVIDGDVSLNLIESLLVSTKPISLTIYIHQVKKTFKTLIHWAPINLTSIKFKKINTTNCY